MSADRKEADHQALQVTGQNLRRIREAKSWSEGQLALHAKVSKASISKIEAAKQVPGVFTIVRLAKALHASVEELVDGPLDDESVSLIVSRTKR